MIDEDAAALLCVSGFSALQDGKYDKAIEYFEGALEFTPWAWRIKAYVLLAKFERWLFDWGNKS